MGMDTCRVCVAYGLGPSVVAELPNTELEGTSAKDVIDRVTRAPQGTDSARRTASILREVVGTGRDVDIEIAADGDLDDSHPGRAISADEPVVPTGRKPGEPSRTPKDLTVRVSEPYVGGRIEC